MTFPILTKTLRPGMMMGAYNPHINEAKAKEFWIQGQSRLGYGDRLCLKQSTNKTRQKKEPL